MSTSLLTNGTPARICKHLPELPPVVSDWQQSCQQPRCPHYCHGECDHPARDRASAPCPFDGKQLLLEDAAYDGDLLGGGDAWVTQNLPKKG